MDRPLHISEIQERMQITQELLSLERLAITDLLPIRSEMDRTLYAAAYVRAEHFGLKTIHRKLADLKFLPLRLDPQAEMMGDDQEALHYWVMGEGERQPSSLDFGNDFMHAITRAALVFGWEDIRTARVASRIAQLFADLSCVIGIIYFTAWMSDLHIDHIKLSNPDDLKQTAKEITQMACNGEFRPLFPAAEQANIPRNAGKKGDASSFLHLVSDNPTVVPPTNPTH